MSDSYILHDVIRKVKADGLFDTIRRDLIADIEQKPSYLDLKSQIESLMSSYLSEHKWSSSLKKSDIRERARRHIETSDLIKDTLPSLVNQYMQTCQQQLVQPRLSTFVSDHLENLYNSIGGTHIYRPSTSYTQSISIQQESIKTENTTQATVIPVKKEPTVPKPTKPPTTSQTSNVNKQKIIPKKKPVKPPQQPPSLPSAQTNPIKEEKKTRILSPLHSPNELVDISPSPPSMENERPRISSSPSPPPPIVRVAEPLTEVPTKVKRSSEQHAEKKKKIKTEETEEKTIPDEKPEVVASSSNETDTRKLRSRRPNPKYLNEQFETDDLNILDAPSSPSPPTIIPKTKKLRPAKSIEDTPSSPPPSSPPPPIETSVSVNNMSPEYGTSLPSPTIERQPIEIVEEHEQERPRKPSPVTEKVKKSSSPRRLRPRRTYERSANVDNQNESIDLPTRTSSKTRHRTEQSANTSTSDDADTQPKKTRHSSSSTSDNTPHELPNRSMSVPDNINTTSTTDETATAIISPTPVTAPPSKSFIWKPKISK